MKFYRNLVLSFILSLILFVAGVPTLLAMLPLIVFYVRFGITLFKEARR